MPEEDRQFADAPRYATLGDYLRVVRERWKLVALCALLFAAAAAAYSLTQEKIYEAETTLNVRQRGADVGLLGTTSGPPVSPQALTAELAAMAERDSIAESVSKELDGSLSPTQVGDQVTASIDVQTNLVVITAEADDPDLAAQLADEYAGQVQAEALTEERDQIDSAIQTVERQLDSAKQQEAVPGSSDEVVILQERFNRLQALRKLAEPVAVVNAATPPDAPVSPKPARNIVLALLAGLFLGVIAAFVRDSLDKRLKSPKQVEESFGLARIGQLSDSAFGRTVMGHNGLRLEPVDLEAARIMRANLDFLGRDGPLGSLLVTSPLPAEGKSTVAAALAWASAVSGKLTLLVECDLRQPVLAERLGLRRVPGLSDVLAGGAGPSEVLQGIDLGAPPAADGQQGAGAVSQLACITAGTPVPNPAELLASDEFSRFLGQVTEAYDLVVLDTSPLLSVVDTRELLSLVEGVVVCARSYQTTRDQAHATTLALEQAGTTIAGLVVTGVKTSDDDYYLYYSRYAGLTA